MNLHFLQSDVTINRHLIPLWSTSPSNSPTKVLFNAQGVNWLRTIVLSARSQQQLWAVQAEHCIPGPLPLPTGAWKHCPSRSTLPCNFICPEFQAPAVFVQIRVSLLYKPLWSFAGHPAAAPLTSPAGPLFAVSKQTALT